MRLRLSLAAIFVSLFALMIACSGGQPSPNAPSSLTPAVATPGPQGSFENSASWSCFTGGGTGRVSSSTNEWTVASESCPAGVSGAPRNAPAATSEPIFAPGPSNFRATVTGNNVLLQWDQTAGSWGWQIEAGSGPGLANLAVQRIGPLVNFGGGTIPFTVTGVPNGVYFARVRSTRPDFSDVSVPSNEIVVTVGPPACAAPPDAPTGLTAAVNGSNVTLFWAAPGTGSTPSSYLLEVGSAPGLSDILVFDTGSSATSLQASAPPRVYFVRLRSRNACGTSAAAASTTVTVGVTTSTTSTVPASSTTTIPRTNTTTTTIGSQPTTTSTTVPGSTTSTTSTTSSSTSSTSTTTTSVAVAPTATFSYSPNPCTISGASATLNCTFNASGSNAGSGTITGYLWSYLNVTDAETSSSTYTPNFGGCGLSGGQQVSVPVTLKVRNSDNVVSAPYPLSVTVRKTNACGFGL